MLTNVVTGIRRKRLACGEYSGITKRFNDWCYRRWTMELSPNAIDSTRHSSTLHSKTIIFIRWTNKITEPRNAWLKNMRKIQYLNSLLLIHPVLLPEFKFSVNTLPICPAAKLSVHFSVYYLCWCCSCILLQLCVHREQTSNEQGKRKKKKF